MINPPVAAEMLAKESVASCPYPVIYDMGQCCGQDPCGVEWERECDKTGGCWDRSTCGDCSQPVFPKDITHD